MTRRHLHLVAGASPASLQGYSDDELMVLAQAGRRDPFAVLVERYAARIAAICVGLVQDRGVGLELAQETWLLVWAERDRYRPQGRFIVWLVTLARNRCRNQLRSQSTRRRHEQQVEPPLHTQDDVERLLAQERSLRVQHALERLPDAMREALLLRFADELRYEEMAQILGVSESTLRSRVHHGLKLLRRWLENGT